MKDMSKNINIIIAPSNKGSDVVIINSNHYNNKLKELLNGKNTHEQISLATINKNIDIYIKSCKKLISDKKNSGLH